MTSRTCETGAETVRQLALDLQDQGLPEQADRLGRTLWRWREQVSNRHAARAANAPTEAANNPMKQVKRAAFGFKNSTDYRIRALPVRRQARLDTARHPHPDLIREEPG